MSTLGSTQASQRELSRTCQSLILTTIATLAIEFCYLAVNVSCVSVSAIQVVLTQTRDFPQIYCATETLSLTQNLVIGQWMSIGAVYVVGAFLNLNDAAESDTAPRSRWIFALFGTIVEVSLLLRSYQRNVTSLNSSTSFVGSIPVINLRTPKRGHAVKIEQEHITKFDQTDFPEFDVELAELTRKASQGDKK